MSATIKIFITFFFALCFLSAQAQEDNYIKDIIESFVETLPEDYDLFELTERLTYYKQHPINLNQATPEDLKSLLFLSPLQINNFFSHLAVNGKLLDLLELQGIEGFDLQTINHLLPFVTVNPPVSLVGVNYKDLVHQSNNDLIIRYGRSIETKKGFTDLPGSRYLGSPDKMLLRYRYKYLDQLTISLTVEKDAGEYLFHGSTGFDHLSGNIAINKLGKIRKLVLGDYALQFGQGLTLWSGFAFGKGPDVTSVASKDVGLRPYSSSNEASFFRGSAATVGLTKNIELTPFVSYRKRDASLKIGESGSTLQNIGITGLHRTKTELKNQNSLGQLIYGGALQYISNNLSIGVIAYRSNYEHNFITGNSLYNKYAFSGKNLTNTGVNYSYTFKNIYFYGEVGHSLETGYAFVNGAMLSLSRSVSAVVLYRSYDRDYHNFFSNGVGEGSEVNNEKGWYAGLNYIPSKRWAFSLYSDYFKFPWLKYRVDSSSSGYEVLAQTAFTPVKTFKILLRYKKELKQQNPDRGSDNAELQNDVKLQDVYKESYRLECNWALNKSISFQGRAEASRYKKGVINETGFLIFQDVNYRPQKLKVSGNMRLAYFNTQSYNSRIYAYEDDVLYGSSFGGYYGKGIRTFINLRYKLLRKADLWFRYAIFIYEGQESVGSGLDEIEGNKKSDFKIQVRYQF